ncbi:hypothetical protein BVY01_03335 [bacterium I07]|nr:hypothetical protein BVY01_03335 [bacterium I07]
MEQAETSPHSEKHSQEKSESLTRRHFITGLASAAAAGISCSHMKTVTVLPPHVAGRPGKLAPSDRLNIAGVGVGGRGRAVLRHFSEEQQNLVALCDVDWKRGASTFKENPKAGHYRDFRVMLDKEEKNIDAVMVATPDHMHAPVAIRAMKMGKHVYCEKPLTHCVAEAREMARVAEEMKVATQMGNQGQADESVRIVSEYIADGCIGKVTEVHNWCDRPRGGHPWPQAVETPKETPPVPNELSWDLWLGVAPERPYNQAYAPFRWRGWLDFGTGALGDIGCHSFHPIFKQLDLGYPTSIEPFTTELLGDTWPLVSMIKYEFPARSKNYPAVTLTWYDGQLSPPRPPELEPERQMGYNGTMFVGTEGTIFNGRIIPESKHKAYPQPSKTLPRSPGHQKEFINYCKGGEPAGANFAYAALVAETVLLGNAALLAERKLEWDAENMKVINVPEANKLISKTYREGW